MNLIKRWVTGDASAVKGEVDHGKLIRKCGRRGRGRGQFDMPCGVAVTKAGDLVVADTENHRIQVFSPEGGFKSKFGEKGCHPEQLCYPIGVATTHSTTNDNIPTTNNDNNNSLNNTASGDYIDNIVVTDSVNAAVKIFSPTGKLKSCFAHQGTLEFPYGVALTLDDHVVVTDIFKHCVVVLTPNGSVSHTFGCYGDGLRQFDHPYCVTTNASRQIIVSDTGNNAIKIFQFHGRLLRCFSSCDFHLPPDNFVALYGVCTDPDNNTIVVCNSGVYILTKSGRLWEVVTSKDGLTSPRCIAYSNNGRLVVTQAGYDVRHELCIFRYSKEDYKSLNTLVFYAISV